MVIHFARYCSPERVIASNELHAEEKEDHRYCILLIVWGSMISCCYCGVEITTFGFFPEFAVVIGRRLHLLKSDAALMASAMSAAFTVNRVICIAVATYISPVNMILISIAMLMIGNVLLLVFANSSLIILWLAVIVIGAGHSSVNPCLMSLIEKRMNVTNTVCGFFMLSSYLSSLILPILMGSFIEDHPLVFVDCNIALLCMTLVFLAALLMTDHWFRRRKTGSQEQQLSVRK